MENFGIRHVDVLMGDPKLSYDFYHRVLGLDLVWVGEDVMDPEKLVLRFGVKGRGGRQYINGIHEKRLGTGMHGTSQITKIMFSVDSKSMGLWLSTFAENRVRHEMLEKKFGRSVLKFQDPDGTQLELVGTDREEDVKSDAKLKKRDLGKIDGIYGVELALRERSQTEQIIKKYFDYSFQANEDFHFRYTSSDLLSVIDIFQMRGWPKGRRGAGTISSVGLFVDSFGRLNEGVVLLKDYVDPEGQKVIMPTPLIQKQGYSAIVFREPGGTFVELAVDVPGDIPGDTPGDMPLDSAVARSLDSRVDSNVSANIPSSTKLSPKLIEVWGDLDFDSMSSSGQDSLRQRILERFQSSLL